MHFLNFVQLHVLHLDILFLNFLASFDLWLPIDFTTSNHHHQPPHKLDTTPESYMFLRLITQ